MFGSVYIKELYLSLSIMMFFVKKLFKQNRVNYYGNKVVT